ncbi:hypothetical protein BDV96DRAFT_526390 [Lophiotrema nucula]|uniref:PH domain-containing protein n=1 Tax=Lophiotrema nucula TaxID=690887 RepID=A0A6A5YVY1_9PLEO|nr:hypothetical protein BDV96DRAFT_526390 [Lophiotrema nucula]
MSNVVAKYAAKYAFKKVLNKDQDKYKDKKVESQYDPYYEMIPHPRKPGKMKKVKKEVPAYIPPAEADTLARARKTAYRLDFSLFNFLGFRFGWSSVIGLVPFVGDAADAGLALNLMRKMNNVEGGLPNSVRIRMVINLIVDFLVGLIPFVGDLADAAIKCNSKNVRLFEEHLDNKYKPKELIEEERRLPKERRPRPATVYEDFSDEEIDRLNTFVDQHDDVRQPTPAYSGRRDRVPDEEMGLPRSGTQKVTKEKPSRYGSKNSRR